MSDDISLLAEKLICGMNLVGVPPLCLSLSLSLPNKSCHILIWQKGISICHWYIWWLLWNCPFECVCVCVIQSLNWIDYCIWLSSPNCVTLAEILRWSIDMCSLCRNVLLQSDQKVHFFTFEEISNVCDQNIENKLCNFSMNWMW